MEWTGPSLYLEDTLSAPGGTGEPAAPKQEVRGVARELRPEAAKPALTLNADPLIPPWPAKNWIPTGIRVPLNPL